MIAFHFVCSTDGVMSYSMRQGERRGQEVDLYDFSYDGLVQDGYLSGGLGQLLDWQEGQYNFRLDHRGVGKKGYEWVGWKNDSLSPSPPVDIVFTFDQIRNFSSIRLHCNNYFTKDVRVFRLAQVYFSIGGEHFAREPVEYEYMRDPLLEFARYVIIPIPHRVGKYVKLRLHFDARWLMISEVKFESGESSVVGGGELDLSLAHRRLLGGGYFRNFEIRVTFNQSELFMGKKLLVHLYFDNGVILPSSSSSPQFLHQAVLPQSSPRPQHQKLTMMTLVHGSGALGRRLRWT